MSKSEFLALLRECLEGKVDQYELNNQLRFYDEYISSGKNGKSEEGIINEIGDPRLIAKTILSTYELSHDPMKKMHQQEETYEEQYYQDEAENQNSWNNQFGGFRWKWYQKVIFGIVTLVVVISLIVILFSIIGFALAFILPIVAIVLMIQLILKYLNKN